MAPGGENRPVPCGFCYQGVGSMANFTEQAIIDTFEEMLSEMPFDRITVTALARRCGISPNTFYYHFDDIYDLLDHWLLQRREFFKKSAAAMPSRKDWMKYVLTTCRDRKELVYHLMGSLSRERIEQFFFGSAENIVLELIRKEAEGTDIPEDRIRTVSQFVCYSTLGFLLRFLWLRMRVDIDREVDSIYGLMEKSLESMLRK